MAIITGTNDPETLPGTKDDDTITGGLGNDKALMGAGADIFIWNPGDGSDVVEGGTGADTVLFKGSNIAETFTVSGNAGRAQVTRDVAAVLMDINDVERLELNVIGGADAIVVNDLTGTELKVVAIDLSGAGTPGIADGVGDSVTLNASGAANTIKVTSETGLITVTGLPATVTIAGADAADGLVINGFGGNDKIDASLLSTAIVVDGGIGNDTITGGQGADVLTGGSGNDTMLGGLGVDVMIGDEGDDTVTGGDGDDTVLLGAGNDRFIWNPGDDNDTVEGQGDQDTLVFNEGDAGENVDISANGGRVRLTRDVAVVVMDLNDVERIEIHAAGGSDRVTVNDLSGTDVTEVVVDLASTPTGTAADKALDTVVINATDGDNTIKIASVGSKIVTTGLAAAVTIDHADKTDVLVLNGLVGIDTIDASKLAAGKIALQINGGLGNDIITGSAGDDTVNGGDGNEVAKLGAGNDSFIWNPGDDNDTIDGGTGNDTLQFNGSNIAERIDIIDTGSGAVRFTRDVANIVMDLDGIETIAFKALGGADTVTVHDLSGTDVKQVAIDLGGQAGGGDGAADTVIADGSKANNTIKLIQSDLAVENVITVTGLPAALTIKDAEGVNDSLVINGRDGNDTIDASALPTGAIRLTLDGGIGNDTILGGQGNDTLIGGDGNDTVTGDNGNDTVLLGAGNDRFMWNPGDGNDIVEGQDDVDTLVFNSSHVGENIDISANGERVLLSRNVANITMDLNDVERLEIHALGGDDKVTVNDLSGTDVTEVLVDLAATLGGSAADTALDIVTVNATGVADTIAIASVGSKILTIGLQASVTVDHANKFDILTLNTLDGDDTIDASKLGAGKLALHINAGLGNDIITGSAGDDMVNGGDGNETAKLGAGDDTFVWNAGDDNDTVDGEAGIDTLLFNGTNIAEKIVISADGDQARLSRDVANVQMLLDGVERIAFNALGGADSITVNDLSGTDVKEVAIDLAATVGGAAGDSAADTISLTGGNGKDSFTLAQKDGIVIVDGPVADVSIAHAEFANDRLVIDGLGGDDQIDAAALPANLLPLTLNGGAGNDLLTGSQAGDLLNGGGDNDTLAGKGGNDTALLGAGNDLYLWSVGDGDDVVEGEAGADTLRATGGITDDFFAVSANGVRAELSATGGALLDADDVERIEIRTLGGSDIVTVNDLTVLDVEEVAVDLAGSAGGNAGDNKSDSVTVVNTFGSATMIVNIGSKMVVTNTATQQQVTVDHWDKSDVLLLSGSTLGDFYDASLVGAGKMALQIFGGLGNDLIIGGAGNDMVDGGDGADIVTLGGGNDTFLWGVVDDSDTVSGGAGKDTAVFNGSGDSELFGLTAVGDHAQFFFGFGAALVDLDDVERVEIVTGNAVDLVQIDDLSGTDVKEVAINLGAPAGDGAADRVFVVGSDKNDSVTITEIGTTVSIKGLPATITITGVEPNESLEIDGGAGNDTINAGALKGGSPHLTLNGGEGNDILTGGLGADQLFGGADNDTLKGGGNDDFLSGEGGKDTFDGGAGNDTILGGAGDDSINAALGDDLIRYSGVLDGHDTVTSFDGNAAGGQDRFDLDGLFDSLGVDPADRAARVSIIDNGSSVDIAIDTDGDTILDLTVATLKTIDVIAVGEDVLLSA